MTSRKGTLLEKNVELMFKLVGLKPELNMKINGYEIDIFIKYLNQSLVIECKQYEKSQLFVRNLIHEWESKKKIIKVNRILLVIFGSRVSESDRSFAKRYNIVIWDESEFERYFNLSIKKKNRFKNDLIKATGLKLYKLEKGSEEDTISWLLGCTNKEASLLLNKKITMNDIIIDDNIIDKNLIQSAINKEYYYGVPLIKILEVMKKYHLSDKKVALMFIQNKGGKDSAGKEYTKLKINLIKKLCEIYGHSFDDINDFDIIVLKNIIEYYDHNVQYIVKKYKFIKKDAIKIVNNEFNDTDLVRFVGADNLKGVKTIINDVRNYEMSFDELGKIFESNLETKLYHKLLGVLLYFLNVYKKIVKIKTQYPDNCVINSNNRRQVSFVCGNNEKYELFVGSIEPDINENSYPIIRFRKNNKILNNISEKFKIPYPDNEWICIIINETTLLQLTSLMIEEYNIYQKKYYNRSKNRKKINENKKKDVQEGETKDSTFIAVLGIIIAIIVLSFIIFPWEVVVIVILSIILIIFVLFIIATKYS